MQVLRSVTPLSPSIIAIGNFDGVHRGHQELIGFLIKEARKFSLPTTVFTFRPHPQIALRPEREVELLGTYEEKLHWLESLGVDRVIEQPFSREFSSIPPEKFFNDILVGQLGARGIVVGYDFAFGKGREGHLDSLRAYCERTAIPLHVVPPFSEAGDVISSSRIRALLKSGDVEGAAILLGRKFQYRGIVTRGDGRGRTIGVPTANFKQIMQRGGKIALPFGVYLTRCEIKRDVTKLTPPTSLEVPAITNVGVRPTFQKAMDRSDSDQVEPHFLVETHLLQTSEDLYGAELVVSFERHLRPEQKFSSGEALRAQIENDLKVARTHFQLPSP